MALFLPTYTDKKTGERKKSAVWWYQFTYAGKPIRESANTTRKTIAAEAQKRRRLELERALAGIPSQKPTDRIRTVSDTLKTYQREYAVNHRQNSITLVRTRIPHLEKAFGGMLLPDLTQERMIEYMKHRLAGGASHRTINIEIDVLSRAIGQTWKTLWPKLKKLEENHDVGQALEPEQEKAVLDAAARNSSKLIYPYLMTLDWTGMRSDEARTLRWSRVDFKAQQITAGKAKSEAGTGRQIPMSKTLMAVLEHHAAWCAQKLGPLQPDWYVFPFSNRTRPVDGARPVTSLKKAWETVRKTAKVNCRLHDLRHSFCTKLAEAGVPESTMLDMMGHVSAAMLRRYSHIRAKARREAITAIEARANSVGVLQESLQVAVSEASKSSVSH